MTRTMRKFTMIPALVIAAAFTAACDDDVTDTTDPLVGDFSATEAVFTDAADPATQFDVIAQDGSFDVSFREDGTFTSRLAIPGRTAVVRTGTFTRNGSNLVLTENGTARPVAFTLTGNNLTLEDPGDRFDFEDTGTDVAAEFRTSLTRQL